MAISGKSGSVAIAGINKALGKWEAEFDGDDPDVTNFTSQGCEENIGGIHRATITLEGPHNPGGIGLLRGNAYVFTLRASNAVVWTVTARVKTLRVVTDHKDAVRLMITARSTGLFVPSVV